MNSMRQAIANAAIESAVLSGDSGEQVFCFAEEFIGFSGHFPGYPILPAILQTLMAQMVAEQVRGEQLEFLALERAKFTRELRPGDQIRVKVLFVEVSDLLRCKVELCCGAEVAASFKLLFSAGGSA